MKFLSLNLAVLILVLSGCGGGEGGDPGVVDPATQSQTPVNTPVNNAPNTPPVVPPVVVPPVVTPPVETPPDAPPPVPMLSWRVTGTLRDGGAFTGTFKYDPTVPARATNVNNLSPNAEFAFAEWRVVLAATANHPEIVFDTANSTQRFCEGACIFSVSAASQKITWTDGVETFYIVMPLPPTVMTLRYPLIQADWGPIDLFASGWEHRYGSGRFEFTLMLLGSGTIQTHTEE